MESETSTGGIKDAIVTLPSWGLAMLGGLCAVSLGLAFGLLALAQDEELKGKSMQLLLVLVPLSSAVIAAVAIRRTSTKEIDALVGAFLDRTMLERFRLWTERPVASPDMAYPFTAVRCHQPSEGSSYAFYMFSDAQGDQLLAGIKSNVFNFEVFATLPVALPAPLEAAASPVIANAGTLAAARNHPIVSRFMGITQGSVSEGYEVKFAFSPAEGRPVPGLVHAPGTHHMHVSLRQKVRENFLASPFLKRYFAEDAAIAIRVLFLEWRASGLVPPPAGSGGA